MVYYRKYRPQTIDQLDNSAVREKLSAALSAPEISHAFLFTGPKGLGKTSAARIVAKVVNCEKQKAKSKKQKESIEPCNECLQCTSTTNGTNMDVVEIDAASNRGIDEIRDLREKVRLSPVSAKKKVYIIDEVHMLTTEAFNALLKTLEEPPDHVIFILCTTELNRVPPTIVSRCFHVPFTLASEEELVRSFQRIADGERLAVDKETLQRIAALSDGGFRDGAKILEELALSAKDKVITKELIEEKYKISSTSHFVVGLLLALGKKDAKSAFEIVNTLLGQGVDWKYFLEQVQSELHKELLVLVGVESPKLKVRSAKFKVEDIKELVLLFSKASVEMRHAVLPQLPIEIAIVEWCVEKNTQHLPHVASDARQSVRKASSEVSSSLIESRTPDQVQNLWKGDGSTLSSLAGRQVPRLKGKLADLDGIFKKLIDEIKLRNHSAAGILRGCRIREYDGKKIVVETAYTFHRDKLQDRGIRTLLEQVAAQITGNPVEVLVELKER